MNPRYLYQRLSSTPSANYFVINKFWKSSSIMATNTLQQQRIPRSITNAASTHMALLSLRKPTGNTNYLASSGCRSVVGGRLTTLTRLSPAQLAPYSTLHQNNNNINDNSKDTAAVGPPKVPISAHPRFSRGWWWDQSIVMLVFAITGSSSVSITRPFLSHLFDLSGNEMNVRVSVDECPFPSSNYYCFSEFPIMLSL
jgi:hypothetical protein